MDIKVLGMGCASCRNTAALIEHVANAEGREVSITKVEDPKEIMKYRLLATPGVVIDGKVVHAGGVPRRETIQQWFSAVAAGP